MFEEFTNQYASTDSQWPMKDWDPLNKINKFEFPCRKLDFVYLGIVQNGRIFIKSARRLEKAISTLASQREECIPEVLCKMTV